MDYFKKRGHKGITVFLPRWRKQWEDTILNQLQDEGILTLTPSRKIEGKLYASYDDRCVLVYFLIKTISVFVLYYSPQILNDFSFLLKNACIS